MISPGQALVRLGYALAIGCVLGLVYGFLRPLRQRCTPLGDGLFLIGAFIGWIYLAFGVCHCDLRPGYVAAGALGVIGWEQTLGRLLRPVFGWIWAVILWPWKKLFEIFRKIYKFLLAIGKKSVTIESIREKSGGMAHGKEAALQAGIQKNKPHDESRHSGRHLSVRGGSGGSV